MLTTTGYDSRGSPHVHGIAWLHNAPEVANILASDDPSYQELHVRCINNTVSTTNPSVLQDGSNISDAPSPQTNPHICNKPYLEIDHHQQDLDDLIATCQRHTRCSPAYCLHTINGIQNCRFNYPKPLQSETVINRDEETDEPTLGMML